MSTARRKFGYGIWALGFGYFVFYTPYSGLTKALSKGLLRGMTAPVSGFEILPISAAATVVGMLGFITAMRWWKYATRRSLFGLNVPAPRVPTFLSGIYMAVIIGTTTLAFSFSGTSIVFVLILLRGGVLIIGPIIDISLRRQVRWFSWGALLVSLLSLMVALSDVSNYLLSGLAVIDVTAYLAAYFFRFRLMTTLVKSDDHHATLRYFVEEQLVATPALLIGLALLALVGRGEILTQLRLGFTALPSTAAVTPAILVGLFYAALCVCTTFIFLDRRENTFCIPMHCGSSLLSGIAASAVLAGLYHQRGSSSAQLASAGLIIVALGFLSPLHHVKDKIEQLIASGRLRLLKAVAMLARRVLDAASVRMAGAGKTAGAWASQISSHEGAANALQRIFLFVCSGNTCRSPMAEAIGNVEIANRLRIPVEAIHASPVRAASAGLKANGSSPLTPEAGDALRALDIAPPTHLSRQLTPEMLHEAEAVYCMTRAHREAVLSVLPDAAGKTWCLDPESDLEDPTGSGPDVYLNCAQRIQTLVRWRLDEVGIPA